MNQRMGLSNQEAAEAVVSALRPRVWLVVVCTLAAIGAAHLLRGEPTYEGRVLLRLSSTESNQALIDAGVLGMPSPSPGDMTSDGVLTEIANASQNRYSVETLRGVLRVEPTLGQPEATMIATQGTPDAARDLASAWATIFVARRNQMLASQFDAVHQELASQVRSARRAGDDDLAETLAEQLARSKATRRLASGDVHVLRASTVTEVPGQGLSLPAAGVLGGVLGLLLAIAWTIPGRRLLTARQAASTFGLPVLVTVPVGAGDPDGAAVGAAEQARARLTLADGGDHEGGILVTPAQSDRFRGAVSAALAASYAGAGRRPAVLAWNPGDSDQPRDAQAQGPWDDVLPVLEELASHHDVVIVDAPSPEELADVLIASARVKHWLVTATLGETPVECADRVRRQWEDLDRKPDGLVLARERSRRSA